MWETCNTNPVEKTRSIESIPELSIYNTNTSLTLLQLKEGVMLIQNIITTLLEKKKTISPMFPFSFIVTTIFPQTTFILGLYRKPEDTLKLNDDGSELKALLKRERKEKITS